MQNIRVELENRSYPILVGRDTVSSLGEVCKTFSLPQRVIVVTDSNVARLYLKQVSNALKHVGYKVDEIVIPHGEHQKSLQRANAVITKLVNLGVGRESALVALGGGVVGDLTGFVAATFRRGLPLIQSPTTLLSQVDSSVGGKVGVNHPRAKNAIGTFYQPRFVFTDIGFLRTLPKREIGSGLGEILKYGIVGGEEMFAFLQKHVRDVQSLDLDVIQETAMRCIAIKAQLVSGDEREEKPDGGRAILNIGHAVGQTLETLSNFKLRHGEAVMVGLRAETFIAKELGILSPSDFKSIDQYLHSVDYQFILGHRHSGAAMFSRDKLVRKLAEAKFALPAGIGKVVFQKSVPENVLKKMATVFFS